MMKPDQRMRLQRLQRLRLAADVLESLIAERPDLLNERQAVEMAKKLNTLADAYEASPLPPPLRAKHQLQKPRPRPANPRLRINCRECRNGTCKIHTPPTRDPADYDHEREQELADRFGHDVPDGSD